MKFKFEDGVDRGVHDDHDLDDDGPLGGGLLEGKYVQYGLLVVVL